MVIERDAPAWRHDGRGATFLHERGTLHGITWRQLVAIEDWSLLRLAVEDRFAACSFRRATSDRPGAFDRSAALACPTIPMPQAIAYDLDRGVVRSAIAAA